MRNERNTEENKFGEISKTHANKAQYAKYAYINKYIRHSS